MLWLKFGSGLILCKHSFWLIPGNLHPILEPRESAQKFRGTLEVILGTEEMDRLEGDFILIKLSEYCLI